MCRKLPLELNNISSLEFGAINISKRNKIYKTTRTNATKQGKIMRVEEKHIIYYIRYPNSKLRKRKHVIQTLKTGYEKKNNVTFKQIKIQKWKLGNAQYGCTLNSIFS